MVAITDNLEISDDELDFSASRSSGPGGQNVNKVSTRITLRFDLEGTETLSAAQKERIREQLKTRISKDGILWVNAQRERSQSANRRLAVERFTELLRDALEVPTARRATRVPVRSKRRRLDEKKRRSRLKRDRSRNLFRDGGD